MKRTAYYSHELKSWVRLDREVDGEYCHTSGYETREKALGEVDEAHYERCADVVFRSQSAS